MTATTDGSAGPARSRYASASEPTTPNSATSVPAPVASAETGEAADPVPEPPAALAAGEAPEPLEEVAARITGRATAHLLAAQHPEGWWKGDLETNVTMDAEDLMLRQFLGIQDDRTLQAAARWIRSQQREDGTWATFHGGPGELSTTVEAYVALRLAGDTPDAPHMAAASAWVRERGGIAAARVFTRVWLALFGWWKWEDLPELPPELIYLPKWFPLNLYSFGQWARQTIVPLTVVGAHRPVRPGPFRLDELHADPAVPNPPRPPAPIASWDGFFQRLDKALHVYRKVSIRPLRRTALGLCARWIIERQENDGCWGGIQPPAVYSVIALHLLGYDLDHPVMRAGLESLDRFAVWHEDGSRMIEACQSPVWDTCLATIALADAGLPTDHPALVKAADWMLGEQIVRSGDWAVRRPELPAGGWAFEFNNNNYPDIDDTAEVVLALAGWPTRTGPGWSRPSSAACCGTWACSPRTAPGPPSTSTTPAASPTCCRSATSARSSTRRRPTSPRTSWRCSPRSAGNTTRAPGAASPGCWPNRSPTVPGSAAGASTTSTAPARWCPP